MLILNINITEFASIKDRRIELDPGLNIIEGENESGKSTLLSFIKFILYGLPKRERSDGVTEKDRSFSWSGGIAAGSMTVRTEKGDFRIERSAREGTRSEKLTIVDLESGTAVHKGEIPGELFLGVPAAIFESSALIKQLSCTSLNGSELGNALQNLLISADENLDTEKASEKLDSLRKKLLHKNGKGGSIYELSIKKEALARRLDEAKQKSSQIMDYEALYNELDEKCKGYKEKLEESKALLDAYEHRSQLIRFDSIHSLRARIDAIEKEKQTLINENCIDGFLPSHSFIGELTLAQKEYVLAAEALGQRRENLQKAEENLARVPDDAGGNDIEDAGGASDIAYRFTEARKSAKAGKKRGVISFIAAFLTIFGSAISLLLRLGISLPVISDLSKAASVLSHRSVLLLMIFLSLILIICGILSLSGSGKSIRKAKELSKEFSFDFDEDEQEIRKELSARVSSSAERERLLSEFEAAKREFIYAEEREGSLMASLKERLHSISVFSDDISREELVPLAERGAAKAKQTIDAHEELMRDLAKYSGVLEERLKETEGLDEKDLRAAVKPEILEKLNEINITMLRREYDFLKAKAESAEQKKYFYDRELIGLRATAENPLRPEALLRGTEAQINSETELLGALELAMTALSESSEAMKKSVTPRLRSRAGELLSSLTGGKYSEIGISSDFDVTVNADGITRPAQLLSAGTRDAVYLALRLALCEVLFREEMPPLLFDEVLSQIDNKRALAVLSMLRSYCEGGIQCLLFSCHTREADMIDANVIRLS